MDDYLHLLTDQLCFRFSCQAEVLETGQIYASWDDFRLDKPKIEIVVCMEYVQSIYHLISIAIDNEYSFQVSSDLVRLYC